MQRTDAAQNPPPAPQIDVVIGVVLRTDGDVLVCQRKPEGHLGGYWEFPGGKREPGESLERCLARELHEEVGIEVRPLTALQVIEHDYPAARVRLHPYLCVHTAGDPQPLGCQRLQWIAPRRLTEFRFPPANEGLIETIIAHLSAERAAEVEKR